MNGHSSASPVGRKHTTKNAFDASISASKVGGSSGSSARDFPGQIAQERENDSYAIFKQDKEKYPPTD
jgi:hypothetical protein